MNAAASSVIIIPSYNESLALPELLRELKSGLSHKDAVIVMDDSPKEISLEVESKCREAIGNSEFDFKFYNSEIKSGRGAAVRRGMSLALSEFPNFMTILECDADGSHRPEDILKIKNSSSEADLIVGSRYLKSSKIVGWPASRRIFSWSLNKTIPRLTGVNLKDITNGLRRYSKGAIEEILSEDQVNKGFIYLSEQAIIISRAKMMLSEEPITFVDRTLGSSTVTWREVLSSLSGIFKLVLANIRK
jgi:glycosyltransferase involved in cell wall biosynthesis